MAQIEQPPQNGIEFSIEDDHNKVRPADIEQDMREMERRKRVEAIMGSKLFREELERIVDTARDGGASSILQQLSDIVGLPLSRVGNVFKATNYMLPINDIRGIESMGYAKGEKILRCKLAATFRMLDLYGFTQGIGAQITARLKVDQEVFLVNPYGMLCHEITASSLNKVDMQGNLVEQGTTNYGVNKNYFVLHSIVHAARPDIRCAIYIGCSAVVAISSLKVGLLPLTRDACVLGEISIHYYSGSLLDIDEREKLVRNLGPISKVMMLCNHGALCCGETIEEAFFYAFHIVQACETQLKLLSVGIDNLILIPEESRKFIYEQARRPPEGLEKKFTEFLATENNKISTVDNQDVMDGTTSKVPMRPTPKWRMGSVEFEAIMRMLDIAGYRTGYIYRHPLIKSELPKPKNDVELPPAVSSLGYLLEEEELYRQGIWKKGDLRKGGDRSRWLNSPNVYQKVEVLETGTPDPKKITKWVAEGSPTHGTPVRIEDPLQFVPTGTNKNEFKRVQQQIKDNRRADKISAGPQSHILEGVTWDEASRIGDASVSSVGDQVVLMGAASKGIIQRGFQHNASVYKAPYAKNPFDNVTDDELNEYKRTVERKKRTIHGEFTDTDFSESEMQSSLYVSAGAELMKHTDATACQSEQVASGQDSGDLVIRIETIQAPVPSQPEVVMSDDTEEFPNEYCQKYQDFLLIDVAAHKEKIYEGDQNIFHNKELMADLKNHLLYQLQKQNLLSSISLNSGSFSSDLVQIDCKDKDNNKNMSSYNSHNNIGIDPNIRGTTTNSYPKKSNHKLVSFPDAIKPSNYEIRYASNGQPTVYNFKNCTDYSLVSQSLDAEKFYSKSLFCYAPNVCESIFESLQRPIENDLILNIPFTIPLQTASAMFTPRKKVSLSSQPQVQTYRTLSHFGFNSPQSTQKIEHKHIPNQLNTKYVPLTKSTSYEEIFSSSRYIDLCENCFEKILRLKPELVYLRSRLRNIVEYYGSSKNDLECSRSETTPETPPTFPAPLEPLIEVSSDLISEQGSATSFTFLEKISRMNYSEESENVNILDTLCTCNINIHETESEIEEKSVSIKSNNSRKLQFREEFIENELSHNASITEIWEFGNWQDQEQSELIREASDIDGNETSLGCSALLHSKPRCFMSREERNKRKHEFQELWEEHISFFNDKDERDIESIFGENSEIEVGVQAHQTEEFHHSPEIFHGRSRVIKRILSDLHENYFNCNNEVNQHETTNRGMDKSVKDCYSMQKVNIYRCKDNLLFPDAKTNRASSLMNVDVAKQYLRSMEEFVLYEQNHDKFIKPDQLGKNEIIQTEPLQISVLNHDDEINDFNFLERIILGKIEINKLKEAESIFEKIESTIRNKLTHSKLDLLLQNKKQNRKYFDDVTIARKFSASTPSKIGTKTHCSVDLCKSSLNLCHTFKKDLNATVEDISLSPISTIECEQKGTSYHLGISVDKFKTCNNITKSYQAENLSIQRSHLDYSRRKRTTPLKGISSATFATVHTSRSTLETRHKSNKDKSSNRNFVLENIRTASIPRSVKYLQCGNSSALTNKKPLSAAATASSVNTQPTTSTDFDDSASVYAFQTKLVRGSSRFWISLSETPDKKLQMKKNLHKRSKKDQPIYSTVSSVSANSFADLNTASTALDFDFSCPSTRVDLELESLSEQIDNIPPRLDCYRRKMDDYGEQLTKCAHNMNECIVVQRSIHQAQHNLRNDILLPQNEDGVSCNDTSFSLLKTED